ncbi:hypothetical protein AB0L31_32955, partial [Streptomyces sp. NPDC052535]
MSERDERDERDERVERNGRREQDTVRVTGPGTVSETTPATAAPGGRLVTGIAWVVLLLGLWLWGREATDVREGISRPATGDMAARPPQHLRRPHRRPAEQRERVVARPRRR